MQGAVDRILNDSKVLPSIATMAETVRNNGEKIRDKANGLKEKLDHELQILEQHVSALRAT